MIYGLVPLVSRIPGAEAVRRDYQIVIFWGGLRWAIALAIVLSLPRFEYSLLPDASLHSVAGGGHSLAMTQANEVAPLIDAHLARSV